MDNKKISQVILKLINANITLGSVESFTGGLFASTIVSYDNISKFYKGSFVTYSSQIKQKLGIDISNGVINRETALAMAHKGKEFLDVSHCISFTGNAGPSSTEDKNVGNCYIALNNKVYEYNLSGTRNKIREKAVEIAFEILDKLL